MSSRVLVSGIAIAAMAVAAFVSGSSAQAQARWVLIGSQSVGFQTDRDTVSGRGDGHRRWAMHAAL
ncbi:MAG: hypothetical protein ACREIP_17555 [Alphaproteobacteria bacterium]